MSLCGTCGQTHTRCLAHKKWADPPAPCMAWPEAGATACRVHGGATATSKAKARERRAVAAAEAEVRRLLDDPSAAPIRDPAGALERLAGRMERALDEIGSRVNDLERLGVRGANGGETLKAEADIWLRLMGQLQSALGTLGRFDLDERRLRIDAALGGQLSRAWESLVDELARDLDFTEAERQQARTISARVLRALTEGAFAA